MTELLHDELNAEHIENFKDFCCGENGDEWEHDMEEFLREDALAEAAQGFNKTHVFYEAVDFTPAGFVALCSTYLPNEEKGGVPLLIKPRYKEIPSILVGRFAVAQRFHRTDVASTILSWCKDMARGSPIGCRFLALHVHKDNARAIRFYTKQGFSFPERGALRRNRLMLYDLVVSTA